MRKLAFSLAWVIQLFVSAMALAEELPVEPITPMEIGLSPQRLSAITQMLQQEVESERVKGAVAVVARHGRIGYLQAVGRSSDDRPMKSDTLFRIASMTKAITSAGVMTLVEDGRIALDDPLSKFLPEFASTRVLKAIDGEEMTTVDAIRTPTIHDMLTHRSGLTYGWFGPAKLDAVYREENITDLFVPVSESIGDRVHRIAKVPLKFQPGTAWDYGVSIDVLGRVIEVVSGLTLEQFLRDRFFEPLRMVDTHFAVPESKQSRLAGLYTIDENKALKPVGDEQVTAGFLKFTADYCSSGNRFYSGGGGLVSTASDYLRFLQMLLNGGELEGQRVLQRDTVALMTQNQIGKMRIPFSGHGEGFGFGFGVLTDRGATDDEASAGTFSWGGIFNTYFWVDPREQLIGVLMAQVFPYDHLTTRADFKHLTYAAIEMPQQVRSSVAASQEGNQTDGSRNLPIVDDADGKAFRAFEQFAMTQQGDAEAGAKLFNDQRTKCATCHRVGKAGGQVGPDLSSIGGKYDRPHLIDSMLYPSRQVGYGYETTTVLTVEGRSFSGIAKTTDDTHITLLDAGNKRIRIAKADIEESRVSKTSIMPSGLAKSLSKQEFTDLISYLESLGPGKGKFGSGISGPVKIADGFQIETVATGLSGAVAMEVAPDGRIFICEQGGTLRVVKDGTLLEQPFVAIPVEMNWERGLIGVTVSPNFPTEPYVYVVYVTDKPYSHHRISRFRADGDVAVPGSEKVLFHGDDQSQFGGNRPAGHQGGAIHFGPDSKLYVAIGEQTAKTPAQRMDALQGKLLRINPDGTIPVDNPFVGQTKGKYQAIWAKGLRNPFTFAFSKSGEMLINDVGGKFEEINRGIAGANYGWPTVDHGPTTRKGVTPPIHIYPQSSIGGGDFSDNTPNWPTEFRDRYFFADFVHGWVKSIAPQHPTKSQTFVSGIRRPVDLRFAPDGSLFVLLRNAWVVDNRFEGGTGALLKISRVLRP